MVNKLTLLVAGLILTTIIGVLASREVNASPSEHTLYVTFGKAVLIPGATLTPGGYIFEEADPDHASNLVRVLSRDRSRVFLTQFATRVERPAGVRADQTVVLGEPQPNEPEQVLEWFEPGVASGYAFNYHGY